MNKNKCAPIPPMGWNSYDYYDTAVNEQQVKANADYMAEHLKEFGWEYIVVDIQWYAYGAGTMRHKFQYIPFSKLEMDEYSRLLPCPERFPSSAEGKGFGPLAAYIHSLGLKFGIHIMRGIPRIAAHLHTKILGTEVTADMAADPSSICGWNPDMYGVRSTEAGQAYYDSLIALYAEWGVDYIKCDDICNTNLYKNSYSAGAEIRMLHNAIERCGRPIVLSLSPGPALIEKAWDYEKYANMWRITDDFWDSWPLLLNMFGRCELWQNHVSAGCYPDCDMLPVGIVGKGFGAERVTNFTKEEQVTMMTLWCIFRSPLMIGAELTKLDEWTLSLLTNRKVLALLSTSCKGRQIERNAEYAVWASVNEETGARYAALFNLSDAERELIIPLSAVLSEGEPVEEASEAELLELWTGEALYTQDGYIRTKAAAHGAKLYEIKPVGRKHKN